LLLAGVAQIYGEDVAKYCKAVGETRARDFLIIFSVCSGSPRKQHQ
jgi:hypothetical protein